MAQCGHLDSSDRNLLAEPRSVFLRKRSPSIDKVTRDFEVLIPILWPRRDAARMQHREKGPPIARTCVAPVHKLLFRPTSMTANGPPLTTWAVPEVGRYLRNTGRGANAAGKAARDP